MNNNLQTYTRLSALGLIINLVEEVRKLRPRTSRNTILLAFREGATTPARKMIVEIGERLLVQQEESTTVQPEQAAA